MIEWVTHKRQSGKGYKATNGPQKILNEFADLGPDALIKAIDHSIANNYQGVFPPSGNGKPKEPERKPNYVN
jgi:hypothetical protein